MGTRPEIVKLAPVLHALAEYGIGTRTVATGQHYDPSLTDAFFTDVGIWPDDRWQLPDDEAGRVGALLSLAYGELAGRRPDLVLVQGDTYTVPAFCLAARRHGVPIVHLEAGLRSFNETSMEEVDRKMAAAAASFHFAPTDIAARLLVREGVSEERIRVVGNSAIDVLRKKGVVARPPAERAGVVMTAHRPSNVDDPDRLALLVRIILRLAAEVGQVTFPVHPRTRTRLETARAIDRLENAGVTLLPPVPYDQMLGLLGSAKVIVTDSGGLQEEAAWLGIPIVVLRRSTPRWEGVLAGTSVLTGLDVDLAVSAARRQTGIRRLEQVASVPCPYGDGYTGKRVAEGLVDPDVGKLLRLEEPDFVFRPPPL
jgi:UDP-N-acetylglucosamine 2-epimerase (non-hydrolysing)